MTGQSPQQRFMRALGRVFILCVVLLLPPGGAVTGQDNGTFAGRVVDVSQQPVAGAAVFVYGSSNIRRPADYISPPSDSSGGFQLTLPAGHYWAVARKRQGEEKYGPLLPGDRHSGAPLEIDITAGDVLEEEFVVADLRETSQLAVKLDTSFLHIAGKLLTKEGAPVDNGYAFARSDPAGKGIPEYVSAWTDGSGGYTLFLPPGTYWLGWGRTFPPGPESIPRQKVTIDKPGENINIVVQE